MCVIIIVHTSEVCCKDKMCKFTRIVSVKKKIKVSYHCILFLSPIIYLSNPILFAHTDQSYLFNDYLVFSTLILMINTIISSLIGGSPYMNVQTYT